MYERESYLDWNLTEGVIIHYASYSWVGLLESFGLFAPFEMGQCCGSC